MKDKRTIMTRQDKSTVALNVNIDVDVDDKINNLKLETGLTKTAIVEKAVAMFFDYYKKTGKIRF